MGGHQKSVTMSVCQDVRGLLRVDARYNPRYWLASTVSVFLFVCLSVCLSCQRRRRLRTVYARRRRRRPPPAEGRVGRQATYGGRYVPCAAEGGTSSPSLQKGGVW